MNVERDDKSISWRLKRAIALVSQGHMHRSCRSTHSVINNGADIALVNETRFLQNSLSPIEWVIQVVVVESSSFPLWTHIRLVVLRSPIPRSFTALRFTSHHCISRTTLLHHPMQREVLLGHREEGCRRGGLIGGGPGGRRVLVGGRIVRGLPWAPKSHLLSS